LSVNFLSYLLIIYQSWKPLVNSNRHCR